MLAACDVGAPKASSAKAEIETADAAGFLEPPAVLATSVQTDGVAIFGKAPRGAQLRLASPGGATLNAVADRDGAWRVVLPPADQVRLFGLSMASGARTVQAQGYLAVTPGGAAALLRSGAGAKTMTAALEAAHILAIDFDAEGGAVVSGAGPAGETLRVIAGGGPQGEGRVAPDGSYSLPLTEPLADGSHRLEVQGISGSDARTVEVGTTRAIPVPPFSAERLVDGWRIDWMTPGGGVQTTLLFDPPPGT